MLKILDINPDAKTVTAERPVEPDAMRLAVDLERLLEGTYSLMFQDADVKSPYAREPEQD